MRGVTVKFHLGLPVSFFSGKGAGIRGNRLTRVPAEAPARPLSAAQGARALSLRFH